MTSVSLPSDTICALATAPGVGGIAVVRVSGAQARSVVANLFCSRSGVRLDDAPARRVLYGDICVGGDVLDDVIVVSFVAPHSYTGEDVVEISSHGSSYIQQQLLAALLAAGCRMAEPGEFTQRAYLNGRMNLSEAEAVADLIASETHAQHRVASQQMRGGYTAELEHLRTRLLEFTSLLELELDFSEEDVEFVDRSALVTMVEDLECMLERLTESYRLGNVIRRGIPVAIAGVTNAGKSTLLNCLVGEERAIVSNIHGTTRDTIEDTVNIGGYLFRFIDTAGLRATTDEIEALGIERSYAKIRQASCLLYLFDGSRLNEPEQMEMLEHVLGGQDLSSTLLIVNKADLLSSDERKACLQRLGGFVGRGAKLCTISAQSGEGLDILQAHLLSLLPEQGQGNIIVSNMRHQHLLGKCLEGVRGLLEGLSAGFPSDLLAQDLRLCISYIGEITGQTITSEDVLHHIFAHFCIGK